MWGEGGKMETIIIFANLFIVVQAVTSAIMCVYGYKWSKGLIAVMSSYVGVALGTVISMILIDGGVGFEILIIIPICAVAFSKLAYEIVALNHFLAGFLLAIFVAVLEVYLSFSVLIILDTDVPILNAIKSSMDLIEGRFWDVVIFSLSFIPWFLLGVVTFGIGLVWIFPYFGISFANYYLELKYNKQLR